MKAVLYTAFAELPTIQTVPDPMPALDGVVVRVEANGICRSDWHGWMGHDSDIHLPHVPGHELAGVVEAVGAEVRRWQPGDRVTVPFAVGCGRCPQCLAGNQHICDDYFQPGFTAWGSFAQYVAIPHADVNLVRLPDALDFVAAASLGCRFSTSFRAVVEQGRTAPGEWVVVHGCGGVGLAAIMIAHALGAGVIGVDIKDETLAFAQSIGADYVINARAEPYLIERIRDLTGGGAHVSLDALGSATTCRNSVLSLRKHGRHVQVGLMVADYKDALIPMNLVIAWELELLGSHGMQAHAYPAMLDMIVAGKLDPQKLIRKTVTLEESIDELMAMGQFAQIGVSVIDRF
ncbi:MAG TPA: zinc-dependent alcohol dehydrogenase family protein [Anaerolineae bacterium]|nr:zinc-dependent alcohol dehydrogenase family protein [Anaerolineae bacterium]HQH38584.1 zinc-dependent alcohol dehydrogenase family protein [Anaerolineae bacterium]